MRAFIKYSALFLTLIAILSLLHSCFTANTPPSLQYVRRCFERDKEDLLLIQEYLITSEYTDFFVVDYINENWEIALADLEHVEICNDAVLRALQRLKERGYENINKTGNTIEFELWSGIRDISCGIAFVAEGNAADIAFLTEIKHLEQKEWHYYITDYEQWRTNHPHKPQP